ncbi:pol5 [Scenedesmus sp. PABB004]|nr:pol5 [Scenedesmus sp. PABB004]
MSSSDADSEQGAPGGHGGPGDAVTGASADPQVLQLFWDLASLAEDVRLTAAGALVAALVDSQKQHDAQHRPADAQPGGSLEAADAGGGGRAARMEAALSCCSPLMAYGLKRLARGLASSRQGARQGFAAALAAVLSRSAAAAAAAPPRGKGGGGGGELAAPFVSAAGVLALLDACLEVTGSMKGSDQRDALLGRVFGLAALARSGLVAALPAAPPGAASAARGVAAVAEQLVGLLQRKAFLRESAAAALAELLQGLRGADMAQVLREAPRLSALLAAAPASASPEALMLALRLWHALPPDALEHCQLLPPLPAGAAPPPALFWQQPGAVQRGAVAGAASALFTVDQVSALCPALLASSASHPRLHPVWGCLLALLVPGFVPVRVLQQQDAEQDAPARRAAPEAQQLAALWQGFVEPSCLSSSHERKALALQLLQLLLPVLTPDAVPVLLSKQLLGCLATALRNKDSYLHASAKKCMERINSCAEHSLVVRDDPALAAKLRLALAAALQAANLQPGGAGAGAKARSAGAALLAGLDGAGAAAYVDQLLGEFVAAVGGGDGDSDDADEGEEEAEEEEDARVRQLLDQLSAALRFAASEPATLRKGLTFLAAAAFLRPPAGVDVTALAGGSAAGRPAPGKGGKAGKGKKAAAAAAAAGGAEEPEQQALALAAAMQPTRVVRRQCGARLIALLHSLQHRAAPQQAKQQQPQQGAAPADGEAAAGESKKARKARQLAEAEAAAAAARAAAAVAHEALAARLLKLVADAQSLHGAAATADEDVLEMVEQLQRLASAVQAHGGDAARGRDGPAARARVSVALVQQLQLQLLAGGLSTEAAGSVVDDLELALVRGLGMPDEGLGVDADGVARALASDSDDGGASDGDASDGGASDGSDGGSDGSDGEPAWADVLVDLLLALLSASSSAEGGGRRGVLVPTAPLREAVEAVFRAFADDVTAQGLADLLRVLGQRASEVAKEQDEEGDDGEMEFDGAGSASDAADDDGGEASGDSSGEGGGSEEEGDEGEEEEEEGEEEEEEEAAAPQPAAGRAAAAGEEAEDDDDAASDLDDEAMLRLDAQLGAAVRASLARSGGGAKERAAALLALQLRVAALVEEWLKRCPKSPLVLGAALPLLRALVAARGAGGSPVLADRLAALLTKHYGRCKPALPPGAAHGDAAPANGAGAGAVPPGPYSLASFEADTRKLLYHASRDRDARVAGAAGTALLVLLAAGADAGGGAAAAAQACAGAAFEDYFEKKKSRLQPAWCEALLARAPGAALGGDAPALGALLRAAARPRNDSVRARAVALLPALLRGGAGGGAVAALAAQPAALAAALGGAVSGPYRSKEGHAAAVKAVAQLLAGVQRQGPGKRLAELLGGEAVRELGKAVVVVKAAGVPPRVEGQLERLVEAAGLEQLVAAGKPDPARLALLNKQRAALLEGGKQQQPPQGGKPQQAQPAQQPQGGKGGKGGKGGEPQGKRRKDAAEGQQQHKKKRKQDAGEAAAQPKQPGGKEQQQKQPGAKRKPEAAGGGKAQGGKKKAKQQH